jgi:hypothetical protein
MTQTDFSTTLVVGQTPEEAFKAITNAREWWSEEIEGNTSMLNDEFNYHFEDLHRCKIRLIEVVPNKKVVWHVLENDFKFTKDKTEWVDTKISFEISRKGDKTQVVFTHHGLVPEYDCYLACREGWTNYIQDSLASLIRIGKGKPNSTGNPKTETEKELLGRQ